MPTVRREVSDRTLFGKIAKWLFVLFNVAMLVLVVQALVNMAAMPVPLDEVEQAGAAVGFVIGIGLLLGLWVVGDIIIGTVVLLTRRKKIIEEEA